MKNIIVIGAKRRRVNLLSYRNAINCIVFLPLFIYALYWGNRQYDFGTDTPVYVNMFNTYVATSIHHQSLKDLGFIKIIELSALLSNSPGFMLSLICIIIAACFSISGTIFLTTTSSKLAYVILLTTSPFYLSINTNVLRHGLSVSVSLLFASLIYKSRSKIYKFGSMYIPMLFHNIAGILSLPLLFSPVKINAICIWIPLTLLSYFSIYYQDFALRFISPDYTEYASGNFNYSKGFRFDFILFSSIPILLNLILPFSKMSIETKWIFNAYLIMNGLGLTMNFVSFSDRFLISSWILLPLLFSLVISDLDLRKYSKNENRLILRGIVFSSMLTINLISGMI